MRIEGPTPEHVSHVAGNLRRSDAAEFLAVSSAATTEELAAMLVQRYSDDDHVYCFSKGATPVAVGAMVEGRPNVITIMFFATEMFPAIAFELARFCKRRLFPFYRRRGVHRIECIAIDGNDENRRWIEMLGMKHEATLRGFGRGGETFHQFAWVADHVR